MTAIIDNMPERDAIKSDEQQGLFRKFIVRRVDGSDQPGGKHHGCSYFVLDVDHDPHARAALAAYATACEASHPNLARDLRANWGANPTASRCVAQALHHAAQRFEDIRVLLINHLHEPERSAFWKAVDGREACREAYISTLPEGEAIDVGSDVECHGLDTLERVCFYEQDFYVLSNFSAFSILWKGQRFATSEAVYHWEKFNNPNPTPFEISVLESIVDASSAHVAFKIGQEHKRLRRRDWDEVKVDVMREILRAKVDQHEYVRRKLLATGDRELVENSWRDDFWGWGPNRDGKNILGKLWMEIRSELRASLIERTA